MGASHSSMSSESVIATGVIAVATVAAGIAYQYQKTDTSANEKQAPSSGSAGAGKKGGKKKGSSNDDDEFDKIIAQAAAENAAVAAASKRANAVAFPEVVPGSFDGAAAAPSDTDALNAKKKEKKAKKKAKKAAHAAAMGASASSVGAGDEAGEESASSPAASRAIPVVTSIEESIVHVPADGPSEPAASAKKEKGKKKKGSKAEGGANAADAASAPAPGPSTTPKPATSSKPTPAGASGTAQDTFDDSSWTRVTSRKSASGMQQSLSQSEILTSDTNLTASGRDTETSSVGSAKADTGAEEEEEEEEEGGEKEVKRKTFAEKMLPKRRTGVEDMEDEPLQPSIARVIRVTPGPNEKPAKGFSWGDYEDVNVPGSSSSRRQFADGETSADGEEDDGWMVKTSRRRKFDRTSSSNSNPSSQSSSQPHQTHSSHAPETLAKRQRQNAAKRDAAKADKQAQEAERLARLAKHKKEVERARIEEQWKHGGGKKSSGGMVASVDEKGGLVWD